jgi:hypothetical protein
MSSEISRLNADIHAIRSAPVLSAAVKATARAEILHLAERGRPDVFGAIEVGERIRWPEATYRASNILHAIGAEGILQVDGLVDTDVPSTMGIVAWLFQDQLIAAVEKEIDQCTDDANALSDVDRAKKLKATVDEILSVERQEEALIEMAATQGHEVGRRPDVDPRAVLGIIGPAPKVDY